MKTLSYIKICINNCFILFFLFSACSTADSDEIDYDVKYLDETNNHQIGEFNDYFSNSTDILFVNEVGEISIPVIYALEVNSHGNIAIPDHSNNTIGLFDITGKRINVIGKGEGSGPGELRRISSFKFDRNDNLWVYDPGLMRLSVFSFPNYELFQVYDIDFYFTDMIVNNNNNIILYSYHHEGNDLILKLDFSGNILASVFEEKNEAMKIFLSRFQGGGLKRGFNQESFYAVYPGEFAIYEISMDMQILSKITSHDDKITQFRPSPPPFPSRLNPNDYTEVHANWWYSFFHISRLFTVEPNFLILSMYEQTGSQEYTFYINIYDLNGSVIVEGLPLPNDARVVGTWMNKVFFVRDEQMLVDGTILPRKVTYYEFEFNKSD